MIVTDRFVFVHLHKAGGSFITEFLLRFFPESYRVGYHYPHHMIPETHRHLPRLGSVRNPWDFYVSYHHFQRGLLDRANERNAAMGTDELAAFVAKGNDPLNGIDILWQVLTDDGQGGLERCLPKLTNLGQDPQFDAVSAELPIGLNRRTSTSNVQRDGFRGMNVLKSDWEAIRGNHQGLFTFLFHHMYGDGSGFEFLKMESLRDDLLAYLPTVDVTVTDEMRSFIQGSARVNASKHNDYRTYYTEALVNCVHEGDGALADRFGYTFTPTGDAET